jgi:propionyl-CoA synthetase
VIATHHAVEECAVIARDDDLKGQSQRANLKGQVPMGLAVLKSGMTTTESGMQQLLTSRIRANLYLSLPYPDCVTVRI